MSTLEQAVRDLAGYRSQVADTAEQLKAIKAELENRPDYKALVAKLATLTKQMDEADQAVRALALEAYRATGTKGPHPAVQVKVEQVLTYDATKALDYAKREVPSCLVLDTRAFTKFLKSLAPIDRPAWATVEMAPKPYVASDLAEWLPRDEAADTEFTELRARAKAAADLLYGPEE